MTTVMSATSEQRMTPRQADYMAAWRELWQDHIHWMRQTILSIVHEVPGLAPTELRLLRNVDDMVGLMTPEYGTQQLAGFGTLLRAHVQVAMRLAADIKEGSPDAAEAESEWFVNAANLSEFLSSVTPYLPYEMVKDMLDRHLAATKNEVVHRVAGRWDEDLANFERMQAEALATADMISSAIIRQFPEKFA